MSMYKFSWLHPAVLNTTHVRWNYCIVYLCC